MTLEDLRKEANNQGYSLTKKITYEKLKPCICGNKRIYSSLTNYNGSWGRFFYCCKCHKKGKPAKYLYQARANWNLEVEKSVSKLK